jgi:LysM repeat protein
MKKLFISLTCILLITKCYTQKDKATDYIATYQTLAINEMIRTGVPAAITLAQGILESSYGESDLCKQSNNHFGIKCKNEWTGDKVYHDDDTRHECFRSYPDAAASYTDHSDFLKNRPYYADLFKLDPTDFAGWAYGLKKAGYATEKDYPQRLLKIINDYNLNDYTLLALQKKGNEATVVSTKTTQSAEIPAVSSAKYVKQTDEKEEVEIITDQASAKSGPSAIENKNYPNGIFTINHVKVLYAAEGTSLLALANQYDISFSKLLEYNDMDETNVLSEGKLVFLEKKMKKGSTDFHIVQLKETLYDICQKEGVRMDCILEYNSIKKNMQPVAGEKIYLRAIAPVAPKTMLVFNY